MVNRKEDIEKAINEIMSHFNLEEKDRLFVEIMISGAYETGKQDERQEIIKLLQSK